MTILTTHIFKFIGESTDDKPTTNIPNGSIFYETDTRDEYILREGTWYLKGATNIDVFLKSFNADRYAEIDNLVYGLVSMDPSHHELHEGNFYSVSEQLQLGAGVTQDYLFTVPATADFAHCGFGVTTTDGPASFYVYEGADRTGSVQITPFNHRRDSSNTSSFLVYKGHTGGTTDGTLIYPTYGSNGIRVGTRGVSASAGSAQEIITKTSTKYIFRVINNHTSNNYIFVEFNWYEHTD